MKDKMNSTVKCPWCLHDFESVISSDRSIKICPICKNQISVMINVGMVYEPSIYEESIAQAIQEDDSKTIRVIKGQYVKTSRGNAITTGDPFELGGEFEWFVMVQHDDGLISKQALTEIKILEKEEQ